MLKGIDFAFGNGLTTDEIKAGGYSFVCRYLSGGSGKDIDGIELANYKAAGIAVVFVWETTGTDMVSVASGIADAQAAMQELARLAGAIGDPTVAGAPVFFAADAATEANLAGYMQGAVSVLGKARTGIYGGLGSVRAAFDAGLVAYGWQTFAWSAGQWDDRALLRQVQNGVTVGPATVDEDEAAYWNVVTPVLGPGNDFGQWPRPAITPSGVTVPELVGTGGNEAIAQLKALGLTGRLSTDKPVVSQTPGAGTVVRPGSNVNLGA